MYIYEHCIEKFLNIWEIHWPWSISLTGYSKVHLILTCGIFQIFNLFRHSYLEMGGNTPNIWVNLPKVAVKWQKFARSVQENSEFLGLDCKCVL